MRKLFLILVVIFIFVVVIFFVSQNNIKKGTTESTFNSSKVSKSIVSISSEIPGCNILEQNVDRLSDLVGRVELFDLGVIDFSDKDIVVEPKGKCTDNRCIKDFEFVEIILTNNIKKYFVVYDSNRKNIVESVDYNLEDYEGKKRLKVWIQMPIKGFYDNTNDNEFSEKINERVAAILYEIAGGRKSYILSDKYWLDLETFMKNFHNNYKFFKIRCF